MQAAVDTNEERPQTEAIIQRFRSTYDGLTSGSMELLKKLYDERIEFIDPVHTIHGIDALTAYMRRMYEGVERIEFHHHSLLAGEGEAMMTWTMEMEHQRLQPGRAIWLPGATVIRFDRMITHQRDYYDLGALLYERVPGLGPIVQWIKKRL